MKKIFISLIMSGLLVTLYSCNKESDRRKNLPAAEPIELKSEYLTKTLNNRSFALDLFKSTIARSNGKNIFIAPYSVNTALNMLWNGTAGETDSEMAAVLGNNGYSKEQINDYSKTLTEALLSVDPTTDIRIANSFWADINTPFKSTFVETNQKWYNAVVKNLDFTKPSTIDEINSWCRKETNGKIDKVADEMDPDTKFALINAIYFKAKWRYVFDKSETRDEEFTNSDGSKSKVKMMNQSADLFYADDQKDWKLLQLPYGNNAFSMVILMPYAGKPLDEILPTLTAEKYYELLSRTDEYSVQVKLPRFKADFDYMLHKEILPDMGIKKVFNPLLANLSEISSVPMFINMVLHKTYIDVYEEGTEAAAITAVTGMMSTSVPGTPIDFYVNSPFVYSIIENSTGTILFMGRINKF